MIDQEGMSQNLKKQSDALEVKIMAIDIDVKHFSKVGRSLEQENKQLKQQLNYTKNEVEKLQTCMNQMARQQTQDLQEMKDVLQWQREDYEKMKNALPNLEEESKKMKEQNTSLRQEMQQFQNHIQALTFQQAEDIKTIKAEMRKEKEENEKLTVGMENLKAKFDEEVKAKEEARQELAGLKQLTKDLQKDIAKQDEALQNHRQQAEEKEKTLQETTKRMQLQTDEISKLASDILATKAGVHQLSITTNEMKKDFEEKTVQFKASLANL